MAEIRMEHPDVKGEITAKTEAQAEVYKQSGWKVVKDKKEGGK